jgi:two-component system KDP operon response regulator KdpE
MHELTILIIDDEPQIRRVVRNALAGEGVRVVEAADGREGIDRAAAERPDLIVLDLGLPDTAGASVCREIRKWSTAPIVVLSARHAESEKVALLDAGADDYITKPFGTDEFRARVRAVLRRAATKDSGAPRVTFGAFTLDLVARTLTKDGDVVHLTPLEWELLRVLATHAGKILTHGQLYNAVWPGRRFGDAQQHLRFHIANLRRKIEDDALDPTYIVTEPGVGYRFSMGSSSHV